MKIIPNISWEENEVLITYNDTELSYRYSSLPDSDLVIPGLDLDEFNKMLEAIRYDRKNLGNSAWMEFVKNFKGVNDPPGYQRCRAFLLAQMYSDRFNIASQSFCVIAYRYLYDDMGSIKELESLYKDLRCFKEFGDPHSGKLDYRWTISVWTALAHCYVKEGNGAGALNIFNKIHSFADITLWPGAIVNVIGACYVTGQSVEYSTKIYEAAIHAYDIRNEYNLSDIIRASEILHELMGKDGPFSGSRLYLKANNLLKTYR